MEGLRILLAVGIPLGLLGGWALAGWREATWSRRELTKLRELYRRFIVVPAR